MVNKRSVDKDLQLCSVLILRYIYRFFIRRNDGFFNKRIVHVAFCDKLIRRIFCHVECFHVACEHSRAKAILAMLARAYKFARPAHFKIALRYFESVRSAAQYT